jgi:tRNA-dihydrouridine synthase
MLGSGDLFSAQDCVNMLQQTGVDGVTVARGAIGNPWIFSQARALLDGQSLPDPPSLYEQSRIMQEHFRLAEELYGPQRCGLLMRKFGIKYSALHPSHISVRSAFAKIRSRADWDGVLERWYAEDLPGQHPPGDFHKVQGVA